MTLQQAAAAVLIAGAILFFMAAFSPISRIFAEPDPAGRWEIISRNRSAWTLAQLFFVLGAAVTTIGLGLVAYRFGGLLLWLGFAVALVASVLWAWHGYQRAVHPQAFARGTLSAWYFIVYTVLTQAALVLFGFGVLRIGIPEWVGWLVVAGAAFFFVAYLIFKDIPPFVYYILTLLVGIVLYRGG